MRPGVRGELPVQSHSQLREQMKCTLSDRTADLMSGIIMPQLPLDIYLKTLLRYKEYFVYNSLTNIYVP